MVLLCGSYDAISAPTAMKYSAVVPHARCIVVSDRFVKKAVGGRGAEGWGTEVWPGEGVIPPENS